ncbi:MAG: SRPBCC domain-containing protein [Gemmatimonadaceae bacterium]|nr:SRPBCC domain-containing protein [Gemmatimonadaceae bacterium]
MPITSVSSDPARLTLTVVADYPVPVERLWEAYADPRQLERFWGPETWPATFTRHDMAVGGYSHYYMTGPEGTTSRGWWKYLAVEPGRRLELEDGFADEHGTPNDKMPSMRMVFTFHATASGSRFESVTTFPSLQAMEELAKMGMEDGLRSAMGQIDAVLADLASFAASRATEAQLLSDTQVRISRVIRGSMADVWRAHHEPELLQRWLLGPDGWTMPVCMPATKVGEGYRYEWESADGTQRFGFEGELLESSAPYRAVTTERMIGVEGPGTRNELTLVQAREGTLLSIVITYPSRELRDMVLGTGMTGGMENSYVRLERELRAA